MREVEEKIDLRGIPCPRNTAKALMFLEALDDGAESLIIIDDGEPLNNFLESLEIETGYIIQEKEQNGNAWNLLVLKEG
ncbi:MAG: sulfurtransferase TusA family protein [Bacteriovorax sp.]|jgi:TusA-related sulfurtransferase